MGVWTPGPGPTEGGDTFVGDGTDETASGLGGNDVMNGNGGNDTLVRIDSDIFITLKNVSGDGDNSISQADFILGV